MNSSTHHNPRSHLSLREVGTKAKNKSIASNVVTVTVSGENHTGCLFKPKAKPIGRACGSP